MLSADSKRNFKKLGSKEMQNAYIGLLKSYQKLLRLGIKEMTGEKTTYKGLNKLVKGARSEKRTPRKAVQKVSKDL